MNNNEILGCILIIMPVLAAVIFVVKTIGWSGLLDMAVIIVTLLIFSVSISLGTQLVQL